MKKSLLLVALVLVAVTAVMLRAADITPYLKVSGFSSSMKTAGANLEKIFMNDQMEFTGEGRKIFIEAWKICQNNKSYPDGGSLSYVAISNARNSLNKAVESLDTLVYDQLAKFKTPEAKALFRGALKEIRAAISYL